MDRRQLLMGGGGLYLAMHTGFGAALAKSVKERSAEAIAEDESFWLPVQQAYRVDSRYILLNAGGSNPCPINVHETRRRLHEFVNASPNINTNQSDIYPLVNSARRRLASHLGVDADELAFTRNTTEGLNIFIASLNLQAGDEILCSEEEYHVTKAALRLRQLRDGIKVVAVRWPVPARSKQQIVDAFRAGFSPRTRALIMCHIQHVGGQIMPVREVCAEARSRGVKSCVDGALGFGHVVTNLGELGCDYYATSLHKYLSAPLGTGLFYVRKPLIASTWPLYGLEEGTADSIRKFEYVGTRPMADFAAVATALDFYEAVGPARKQARLHHLKRYWMDRLAGQPRLRFSVSPEPEHSCASVIVAVDGMTGRELNRTLAENHGIWCFGPVTTGSLDGVYAAPNLFTTLPHLDRFVGAMRSIASA